MKCSTSTPNSSMSACHLCPPDLDRCRLCCSTGKWHVSVPLEPYVSKQGASMDRDFAAKKITFEKGGKCGILIKDGTSKSYEGLKGRDSRPFEDMDIAGQVTLKIKVGYWKLVSIVYSNY